MFRPHNFGLLCGKRGDDKIKLKILFVQQSKSPHTYTQTIGKTISRITHAYNNYSPTQ